VTTFGGHDAPSRRRSTDAEQYDILSRSGELDVANRKLRLLNEELEAFSYSVSHDLRAPVRHILGFMQMLLRTAAPKLSEKERRYLDTIRSVAQEAGRLIDDLLSFARMARAEVRLSRVDMQALVESVRASLAQDAAGREVQWTVHRLPNVRGDREMLRLVVENLLSNALKYTRTCARAEIEVGSDVRADGSTTFFVKDNGVGFDVKYAGKLFGVFQRLPRGHADGSRRRPGTGWKAARRKPQGDFDHRAARRRDDDAPRDRPLPGVPSGRSSCGPGRLPHAARADAGRDRPGCPA
jgi:light-regulated signal transduction histidine kinase (bacteriophytochrome)